MTRQLGELLATGTPVALACDPTPEGVLAAIGLTYLAHAHPHQVRLVRRDRCQPMLGETVFEVRVTDDVVPLSRRVWVGLRARMATGCAKARDGRCPERCTGACTLRLTYACASDDDTMPEAVHRYVRLAFARGPAIRDMLSHPAVSDLDALACRVSNECEHTRQFVRFSRTSEGTWFASFSPNANTIPLVATHFASRMRGQRFCLVDPVHGVAALHEEGKSRCAIALVDGMMVQRLLDHGSDVSADEAYVRAMWQTFYQRTSLGGRDASQRGYDLRAKWMPKRFWGGLTELAAQEAPTHNERGPAGMTGPQERRLCAMDP